VIGRLRLLLVASIVLASCGGGGEASQRGGAAGERLPDVELVPLAGGAPIQLSDVEGPAVVNLWATWCAPCRAEIPDFEEVHQERSDEVTFVGINVGEDGDRAAAFIDDVGATYDQFLDSEGFVVTELNATAMPVTLVLDADGEVVVRHLGPLDQDGLNDAIDEALGSG
jgi:thiol-disulfide isomerase/thioredoxin